jgi:hypothetical protein
MINPMWKVISLVLALGVFLAVGVATLVAGEELVWAVGKSIGAFFVSWIILNHLGAMLLAVLDKPEDQAAAVDEAQQDQQAA